MYTQFMIYDVFHMIKITANALSAQIQYDKTMNCKIVFNERHGI